MQIEKPKTKRVYVTAIDPDGNSKSKSLTVYDTTPEQFVEQLREAAGKSPKPRRDRRTVTA